jgi:hypothetical protein
MEWMMNDEAGMCCNPVHIYHSRAFLAMGHSVQLCGGAEEASGKIKERQEIALQPPLWSLIRIQRGRWGWRTKELEIGFWTSDVIVDGFTQGCGKVEVAWRSSHRR